jgi:solute carrier family 13 (sodium-dependent dicarboxylate transporter), member 2/3/5
VAINVWHHISRFGRRPSESLNPVPSVALADANVATVSLTSVSSPGIGFSGVLRVTLPLVLFFGIYFAPTPDGLTVEGQKVLAVLALAVTLWATQAVPIAVVGIVALVLLVLTRAVSNLETAIYGFTTPVPYFIIGALTLGLVMQNTGLAQRLAFHLIRMAGSNARLLYVQTVLTFCVLSFLLPMSSNRVAVLLPIYQQVMDYWKVPQDSPLNKGMMMAIGLLNRMASIMILAGGATPLIASSLIGDFSWTRWFILMSVPIYANLIIGAIIIYFYYRAGFRVNTKVDMSGMSIGPVKFPEVKAALIILGASLMWVTDFAHGMPPALPALIAMVVILLPKVGLLSWHDFERNVGWSTFFAIAAALSLAHALSISGAATWVAGILMGSVQGYQDSPMLLLLALAIASVILRLMISNSGGYLAFVVPIAMSTGLALGLNPLIVGMTMVVVGDLLVFYAAQANGTIILLERANLSGVDLFKLSTVLTVTSIMILFAVALPYWGLLGESLIP